MQVDAMLLLQAAGAIGLFSARAFVPAFLAAVLMRYGDELAWVKGSSLVQSFADAPAWFTHDYALLALGALAVLEVAAQHQADARHLYDQISAYAKAGLALATTLGVSDAIDAGFVEGVMQQEAGLVDYAVPAGVGVGVFLLASLRNAAFRPLAEADEDDDLGLQGLWAWVEDFWASFGVLLLILVPVVVAVITGVIVAVLLLLRARARVKEAKASFPCSNCGTPTHGHAAACPSCKTAVAQPRAVGFFGQPLKHADPMPAAHDLALLEKRRCPTCATRLEKRRPRQACPACGTEVFADAAATGRYTDRVANRLPGVMAFCALVGWVPILGLIAGVIAYRLKLAAPFSRYLPWRRAFVRRLFLRVVLIVLGLLGLAPVVGMITIPLMGLLSFGVYRGAFDKTVAHQRD